MKAFTLALLAALCLLTALTGCAKEKAVEERPLTYEDSFEATVTARVRFIDQATRVISLENASVGWITFVVSDEVQRLSEVRVGDEVRVRYRAKLLAELRPATVSEAVNPITVSETEQRVVKGATPARTRTEVTTIVTTVEAVDVQSMLVTLRGPLGDVAVVRGRNPDNVRRIRVGDTIVITFTESTVISLEKLAAR